MKLTSREVLLTYANRGVCQHNLRYSRDNGHIKFKVVGDPARGSAHFEYESEDVEDWIENYLRAKDGRRGRWREKGICRKKQNL